MSSDSPMLPLDHAGSGMSQRPCRHAAISTRLLSVDNLRLTLRLADKVSMHTDGGSRGHSEDLVRDIGAGRVEILSPDGGDLLDSATVDLVLTDQYHFDFVDYRNTARPRGMLKEYNLLILPPVLERSPGTPPRTSERPFRLASVGGTFNRLHWGHERYLRFALNLADEVHIFIANDDYAAERKEYEPTPFGARRKSVQRFLAKLGAARRTMIEPLRQVSDIQKYAVDEPRLDLVLAERTYVPWFVKWNDERIHSEREAYKIMCRPRAVTPDGTEVASSLWAGNTHARAQNRPATGSLFE